jgi:antitoxin VapB
MALSIKDPEADRLARQVSRLTGESLTAVVVESLRERLLRLQRRREPTLGAELLAIGQRCASLPLVDSRTPGDLLGYDENGVPR